MICAIKRTEDMVWLYDTNGKLNVAIYAFGSRHPDGTIAFVNHAEPSWPIPINATGTRTQETGPEGQYGWLLDLAREHGLAFPGDEEGG